MMLEATSKLIMALGLKIPYTSLEVNATWYHSEELQEKDAHFPSWEYGLLIGQRCAESLQPSPLVKAETALG